MERPHSKRAESHLYFKRHVLPWIMFSIGVSFYCYVYFLRVSPSTMKTELIQHFHISAAQFGHLAAFYYYAYTPMQIPVGVLIDKYGVRTTLMMACLICAIGVTTFISADQSYALACFGRFLMGFGAAFGYISVLKISALWLPTRHFALAAGLTTALAMTAAIFTDFYLAKWVHVIGYDDALFSAIITGLVLAAVIFLFLRNRPRPEHAHRTPPYRSSFPELLEGLRIILSRSQTWYIGAVGFLLYLPASVFMDLWGIPYFQDAYHLTSEQAANMMMMPFIGWIIGSPATGYLSDKIGLRRPPLIIANIGALAMVLLILYVPQASLSVMTVWLFLLGLFCGAHPLVFSLIREKNSNKLSGTSTSTTNFMIMMGGVIFQPFVGVLLNWHWHSHNTIVNGLHSYSANDYHFALAVIPIGLALSTLFTLLIKETYCHLPEDY
jgi:MFS family permease